MWKDPIVEEVRKERLKIEQECGNSFKGISARALEIQEKVKDRLSDRRPVQLPAPAG
jgi:hypothetical protein